MRKLGKLLAFTIMIGVSFSQVLTSEAPNSPKEPLLLEPIRVYAAEPVTEVETEAETETEKSYSLTDYEIDLIALVTMAEAEGECEEGKRLVIDTILNRVDSIYFPDTVENVIYQKNAFEAMWNGRVDKCYVMNDIRKLVIEELENRTNHDVVFFTAGRYSYYGVPMFQVGNHCFSKYE